MNYDQPRELVDADGKKKGLWHYTRMNNRVVWPIGYCAESCPGHATEEEACEHYKEYILDESRFLEKTTEWPKEKCDVKECNEQATFTGSALGQRYYDLCPAHANRETLNELVHIGWSCSS